LIRSLQGVIVALDAAGFLVPMAGTLRHLCYCRAVSGWASVTFVYCVETAKVVAVVAIECE